MKKGNMYYTIRRFYRSIYYWYFIRKINNYQKKLKAVISRKDEIVVVFFVINLGMWKLDRLVRELQKEKKIKPVVVSFLYPNDTIEYKHQIQSNIRAYFTEKGVDYYDCYNELTEEWLDLKEINADIVFYAQPYNNGPDIYKIEKLYKHSLFAYIPYCYLMEKGEKFHNYLLYNVAWKLFFPSKYEKITESKFLYNKGENIDVTGYPIFDELRCDVIYTNRIKKRVIWAPHHSILEDDTLNYSNFLQIADDMLKLADKYSDRIHFIFKPHPRLQEKLYKCNDWGVKKTDIYYNKWRTGVNTSLEDGNYIELFNQSDAMIHDCSSFSAEYLLTLKPVMYLAKEDHLNFLNEFGVLCYEQHYKGHSISDVEKFLNDVVLLGIDTMKEKRCNFYDNYLKPPMGKTVIDNIVQSMKTIFDVKAFS